MASKTVTRSITSTKNIIVIKVGEGYNGKKVMIQRLLFVVYRDKKGKLERPLELWLRYLAKKWKIFTSLPYTSLLMWPRYIIASLSTDIIIHLLHNGSKNLPIRPTNCRKASSTCWSSIAERNLRYVPRAFATSYRAKSSFSFYCRKGLGKKLFCLFCGELIVFCHEFIMVCRESIPCCRELICIFLWVHFSFAVSWLYFAVRWFYFAVS